MKSEAFQRGFDACVKAWQEAGCPVGWDKDNPFPIGSEEEEGWEAAVYELPQK